MNKINIAYVFGLVLFLTLLMFYKSTASHNAVASAVQENVEMEQLGKRIRSLQEKWDNTKQMQRRIDTVLMQNNIRKYVDKKSKKGRIYEVQFKPMPSQMLDFLTTKLFNAPIAVSKLSAIRSGDQNVSLNVEFAL
jgi:hypothetical protein